MVKAGFQCEECGKMASCPGEIEQVHRVVCGKRFDLWQTPSPQEVTDSGGGEGVDAVLASSTDPDKTAIKRVQLTFDH